MSGNVSNEQAKGLEYAMNTVFACRSVIRYNTVLSGEQKDELIAEIDSSLQFLRESLILSASQQTRRLQFQQPLMEAPKSATSQAAETKDEQYTLRELYRLYHAYIDAQQSNNIGTLVVRFDSVIAALNEIQQHIEKGQSFQVPRDEDPLHRVRAFIADLYYMFMELVRTLSRALEESDVHLDTNEQPSRQGTRSTQEEQAVFALQRLAPLMSVFTEHQRINETREELVSRISDTTAFLIYLEENLAEDIPKRGEVVSHLYKVSILLGDLAYLISSYESAVSLVLDSG